MLTHLIRACAYEPRSTRLIVAFVNGRIAIYDGVPEPVADEFLRSPSKDGYFTSRIHDHYSSREVGRRAA